ncbi:interferon alpha/beta receptor 1 isoform X4 [Sminthopsis crassicaudata]|uniref:interferon alpha/beta receptor 1 isoform X4 n=2 Tax=Sminthopsis crassicaudata TaxID=9301 RepID=UPI003D690C0B
MLSFILSVVLVLLVASGELSLFPLAAGEPPREEGVLRRKGEKTLKTPQNVSVEIIDHNFILKWNWDKEPTSNVTFSAYYQKLGSDKMNNWIELIGCQNIIGTKYNFTLTNLNIFEKIREHIRSEKGQETSSWNVIQFAPFQIAQIGPPEIQLEAEDPSIKINMSLPGTANSMWATDISNFTCSLIILKNSSSVEKIRHNVFSRDKINNLSPETTYCLKVQARLPILKKNGSYNPIFCLNITAKHKLPRPENVEVDPIDNYILKWNYPYENMKFQVQYLLGYFKRISTDYSDKWKIISACENIISRCCNLSKVINKDGIYYLRVQALNGSITSLWSAEKKFDTRTKVRIGPPNIEVKSSEDSFFVYITVSGESEKKPLSQDYSLSYEIIYWENASNIEHKMKGKQKLLKVSNLKPLVLYCFKVRALLDDDSNKSTQFGNVVCSKITPGKQQKTWIIVTCFLIIIGLIFISFCLKVLLKLVKYVFYPSCKPPSNMFEELFDQPLKSLLITSEEQTESCIIEKANIIELEETNQNGKNDDICSKQDNHDSGNCSNEDEISNNKITEETLQQLTMQQ